MKRKSRVFLLSLILTFGCILCLIYHKDSLSHITSTQLVKSFNFKNINEYQVNNSKDLDLEIPLNPNNNGNKLVNQAVLAGLIKSYFMGASA